MGYFQKQQPRITYLLIGFSLNYHHQKEVSSKVAKFAKVRSCCSVFSSWNLQLRISKVESEPYYLPIRQEVELFEAAYAARLPAMLKGPTGCGKTRFVEYMAYSRTAADHRRVPRGPFVNRSRR